MVNKIVILTFALLTSVVVYSQEKIKWMSLQDAITENDNSNTPKKFVVTIYTDKCGWCRQMESKTFSQDCIAKTINNKFYPIKFHADTKESIVFKGKEYKARTIKGSNHEFIEYLLGGNIHYPTVVFLDEDYNVLQTVPGFHNAEDFEKMVEFYGDNHYQVMSWRKFIKQSCSNPSKSMAVPVGNNYEK